MFLLETPHPTGACHHNSLSGTDVPSRCTSTLLAAQPLRIPFAGHLLCHILLCQETHLQGYFSNPLRRLHVCQTTSAE